MSVVPVIDLALARASSSGRHQTARTIDRANATVGFLTVTGHGVPDDLLTDLHAVTAEFFDSGVEAKLGLRAPEPGTSRGYMPPKSRALARTRGLRTPADLVEFFSIGQPNVPNEPYYAREHAGVNFRANIWPAHPPGFREIWTAYYRAMENLAAELMTLFALALRLPERYFEGKINKHISNLFANHYPPLDTPPEPGQLRVGEHTDYGSLTVLYQADTTGGLEVFVDGRWQPVAPVPGTFVINIGDLMARWTNDRWISTLHRVQNPTPEHYTRRRISFPFFCQPNYDTVIECLPTCTDDHHRTAR
ncbi:MAG TPA: 2OG-Fe(II) oxygenase family protein, partial [Pseudonocardia sp.]